MQGRSYFIRAAITVLLVPLALLIIPGCGGSTSGTGGVTVRGQIVDTTGKPLANTTIVALQGGDTTSSDDNGQFELQTEAATKLDFEIEQPNVSIPLSIDNVPANAAELVVKFTVDQQKGKAESDTISVKERDDDNSSSSSKGNQSSNRPPPSSSGSSSSKGGSQSSSDDDETSNQDSESSSSESSKSNVTSSSQSSSSSEDDGDDDEIKINGQITAISGGTVTVESTTFTATAKTEYEPRKGQPTSLSGFSVGERVKAEGKVRAGILELDKLESKDD